MNIIVYIIIFYIQKKLIDLKMENKNSSLVSDSFIWGINIEVNDKIFTNKDIIIDQENAESKNKLNKDCSNYDEILLNVEILKNNSDLFLQNLLDQNPTLINFKEQKENIDQEEKLNE